MTSAEVTTRPAGPEDAQGMGLVLGEIIRRWNSPRAYDPAHVLSSYIAHADRVQCTVALLGNRIIGFQSLRRAVPDNEFGVTPGWGIIGSYVAGDHAGRGVGRALFAATLAAARAAGLPSIDATIGAGNDSGLTYYEAMGFRTYCTPSGRVCKRFEVAAD